MLTLAKAPIYLFPKARPICTLKLTKETDLSMAIRSGKEVIISAPYYADRGYTHTVILATRDVNVYDHKGKQLTAKEMFYMMETYVGLVGETGQDNDPVTEGMLENDIDPDFDSEPLDNGWLED